MVNMFDGVGGGGTIYMCVQMVMHWSVCFSSYTGNDILLTCSFCPDMCGNPAYDKRLMLSHTHTHARFFNTPHTHTALARIHVIKTILYLL